MIFENPNGFDPKCVLINKKNTINICEGKSIFAVSNFVKNIVFLSLVFFK